MSKADNKILFISFFAPPIATIGATRVGKLVKYFGRNEWKVYLLTADEHSFRFQDKGAEEDIKDAEISRINPVIILDKRTAMPNRSESKTVEVDRSRHNLFIRARIKSFISGYLQYFFNSGSKSLFRIKDWEQGALNLIIKHNIKYVYVTFSPLLTLKTGIWLKKKLGNKIFLIADFRDLIVDNPFSPSNVFSRAINKKILKEADLVTTVSEGLAHKLRNQICECCNEKEREVLVVRNGFDPEDVKTEKIPPSINDEMFKLVYTGSLYIGTRDPTNLFIAIKQLKSEGKISDKNFKFIYCGKDFSYIDYLSNKFNISDLVLNKGLVSRKDAISLQGNADMLVVLSRDDKEEEGVLTGKVYEYIASGRPILLLGDGSVELKNIIYNIPGSKCIKNSDIDGIRDFILSAATGRKYKKNVNIAGGYSIKNSPYSYPTIVKKFIEYISRMQHD